MEIPDLLFGPLMALLISSVSISITAGIHVLYRDKTIWYKITHQAWLWDIWRSPTNELKLLAVLEKDVDSTDMTFGYRGGTYQLSQVDQNKNTTEFSHKGKPAYIHTHNMMSPHAFVPHSLDARITPQAVHACKDGNVRRQIDSIRVTDPIPKTSWFMIFLIVIVIIAVFVIYQQMQASNSVLNQIAKALAGGNSTGRSPI